MNNRILAAGAALTLAAGCSIPERKAYVPEPRP
jgi:hypothetical protein